MASEDHHQGSHSEEHCAEHQEGHLSTQKRKLDQALGQEGDGQYPYLFDPRLQHYLTTSTFPSSVTTKSARNSIRKAASLFTWHNDLLCRILPDGSLRQVAKSTDLAQIFSWCHDQGHPGQNATYNRVRRTFWWEGMKKDCIAFVRGCVQCQKQHDTSERTDRELQPISIEGLLPFQKVAVDLAGPLPTTPTGNKHILVFICYLTKWMEAIPLPNTKASTVAAAFINECVSRYGCPLEIVSDNGTAFDGKFASVLHRLGIQSIRISPYHPQANGLVERCIQTLKGALSRMAGTRPTNWDSFLGWTLFAYRNGIQKSTGYSPYHLLYGRDAIMPEQLSLLTHRFVVDESLSVQSHIGQLTVTAWHLANSRLQAQDNVSSHQEKQKLDFATRKKSQATRVKKVQALPLGSLVLAKRPSSAVPGLHQSWRGPYELLSFTTPAKRSASIKELSTNKVVRRMIAHLKPFHPSVSLPLSAQAPAPAQEPPLLA